MTNKEALLAQTAILDKVPESAIEFQLASQGLPSGDTFDATKIKELDLAFAGIILWVVTLPKSVSELDYSITMQDADTLLKIRSGILSKWGVTDELTPTITAYIGW